MLRIIIHSYILNYHRLLGIIFVKGGLMRKLKLIAAIMLFFIIGTSEITIAQKKDNVTPFRKGTLTAIVGAGIGVIIVGAVVGYGIYKLIDWATS